MYKQNQQSSAAKDAEEGQKQQAVQNQNDIVRESYRKRNEGTLLGGSVKAQNVSMGGSILTQNNNTLLG